MDDSTRWIWIAVVGLGPVLVPILWKFIQRRGRTARSIKDKDWNWVGLVSGLLLWSIGLTMWQLSRIYLDNSIFLTAPAGIVLLLGITRLWTWAFGIKSIGGDA